MPCARGEAPLFQSLAACLNADSYELALTIHRYLQWPSVACTRLPPVVAPISKTMPSPQLPLPLDISFGSLSRYSAGSRGREGPLATCCAGSETRTRSTALPSKVSSSPDYCASRRGSHGTGFTTATDVSARGSNQRKNSSSMAAPCAGVLTKSVPLPMVKLEIINEFSIPNSTSRRPLVLLRPVSYIDDPVLQSFRCEWIEHPHLSVVWTQW